MIQWSGMRRKNDCVQGTQTCHPPQVIQPSVGDHGAARSVLIADSPGFLHGSYGVPGGWCCVVRRKLLFSNDLWLKAGHSVVSVQVPGQFPFDLATNCILS